MIKHCWKCKSRLDTAVVDTGTTVGLCQRCYDHFDDKEMAPTAPVAHGLSRAAPQGVPAAMDHVVIDSLNNLPGTAPSAEVFSAPAAENALTPMTMREAISNNFSFEPPMERLKKALDEVIAKAISNETTLEEAKKQIEQGTIAALREIAPVEISDEQLVAFVHQVVEKSFAARAPVQPVPEPTHQVHVVDVIEVVVVSR